jgi:hypothetical protein
MQIKFVEEYDSGTHIPTSKLSAFAVSIMGDVPSLYYNVTKLS